MAEEFYFDTSIWLDLYENRGRNGILAFKLFAKIIENNFKIAYSDLNVKELKNLNYSAEEINQILSIAKPDNIKHLHIYKYQLEEAKKLALQRNIPRKDALHAVIARDNEVQLIATDIHFEKLKDIIVTNKPEDFI